MKFKGQRPAAPAGCVYRWVKDWGWGLFSRPAGQGSKWIYLDDGRRVEAPMGRISAPRTGLSAPKRWADQPIETPPFKHREAFEAAGWRPVSEAEQAEARELFRRRRDYASGIYRLEIQASRLVKRLGIWTQMQCPISGEEWAKGGYSVSSLPDGLMPSREDRALLARILEKSPGRNQGRPLIGDRPMTPAQRVARHRAKKKLQLPATQRALPPGAAAPLPLGPAVPGPNIWLIERNKMLLERMVAQQDEILARLDRLLEVLLKDLSRPITREEFQLLAWAGSNRQRPH